MIKCLLPPQHTHTHMRAYHTFARGALEMPANSLSEKQGVAFSSKMPQVSQKVRGGERAEMAMRRGASGRQRGRGNNICAG